MKILNTRLIDLLQKSFREASLRARKLNRLRFLRLIEMTFTRGLLTVQNYKGTLAVAGIIIASVLVLIWVYIRNSPKVYYVAYVGRDQRLGFDDLHEFALKRLIAELNTELHGVRLELKRFSNKIDEDHNESTKVYEDISSHDEFVVVIDNTWGSHLRAVSSQIRAKGIPVIAINADKQDEDYSQNVVFMGYDDGVPKKVVNFSNLILKNADVIFITEESYPLTNQYIAEFETSNIKYRKLAVKDDKVNDIEKAKLFAELDREFENREAYQKSPIVIVNTHGDWGVEIINHLDTQHQNVNILGGPYIINWLKYRDTYGSFGQHNNKLILFTYPRDAVIQKVYVALKKINDEDLKKSKAKNPGERKKLGSFEAEIEDNQLYVKRCLDAVSIIREVFHDKSTQTFKSAISRNDFIKFFREKLAKNEYITTPYDLYSFDENLLLRDERSFEEHSEGQISSYQKQLNPEGTGDIPNISLGIDNISISNIDLEHRSFHADFYYWLTFAKDHPDVKDHIVFRNQKTEIEKTLIPSETESKKENPQGEEKGDGREYKLYKMSGDFIMDVDFGKYPFDNQELKIEIDLINPAEELRISLDRESLKRSTEVKELSIDEWDRTDLYITVDNYVTTSLWGGPERDDKRPQKFKALNIRIPISRRWTSPLVTIVLPLFMIGIASVALLYVKDNSFANIGEVCVGIFLSIVTYSIAYAQITPRSNVLTKADLLFYGTFFTVLLIFLKVIFFNSSIMNARAQSWVRDKATLVGHVALISYCLMVTVILVSSLI